MFLRMRYEARRRGLLKRAPPGPVKDYLSAPWPALDVSTAALPMLALDLETSGLNPKLDDVVSVGWVLLDAGRINLSSARHHLVKPRRQLPATSVVIHGIGDDQAATGEALPDVLNFLLSDLKGRVLVGHHIGMDAAFVATACHAALGARMAMPCVDTLQLLERDARRRQQPIATGSLTLGNARANRGLPAYPNHNALWDAISAAELWLALNAEYRRGNVDVKLGSVARVFP